MKQREHRSQPPTRPARSALNEATMPPANPTKPTIEPPNPPTRLSAATCTQAIADLDRDGFAIVRGVFAVAEIDALDAAADALVAHAVGLGAGEHDIDGSVFVLGEPRADGRPNIHRIVWAAAASPTIDALSQDPRLLQLASAALGGAAFDQLIAQLHPKLPGDDVDFAWHQDAVHRRFGTPEWRDAGLRNGYLQCLIAIDANREDNGPLRFIRGSHESGVIEHGPERTLAATQVSTAQAVSALLAPGDVAIFGPLTIHGSSPNASNGPRRVLVSGFAALGANSRRYPGRGAGRRVTFEAP